MSRSHWIWPAMSVLAIVFGIVGLIIRFTVQADLTRSLAAANAELASVRDSLRVERADYMACLMENRLLGVVRPIHPEWSHEPDSVWVDTTYFRRLP